VSRNTRRAPDTHVRRGESAGKHFLNKLPSFVNPETVPPPLGLYSHTVEVPGGTSLIFVSGQLGVQRDGTTPLTIDEQADQLFSNIGSLLDAHDLTEKNIVKRTTFIVQGHDGQAVRNARLKHLGACRPASTAVFVPQLMGPAG
jgi:enamine deaminase RidA (YjgF/YER057c/UK114 family)